MSHATFVWASYGVTALTVAAMVALAYLKLRRAERRQSELDAVRPRRRSP